MGVCILDTKHGTIKVDECDTDMLVGTCANVIGRNTYAVKRLGINTVSIHRLIMERMLGRALVSGELVDHINNNGLDNRRCNIRLATRSQNGANSRVNTTSISGYKGVSWYKRDGNWTAAIRVNGVKMHLGYFDSPEDAHESYITAANKYFGKFANDGTAVE